MALAIYFSLYVNNIISHADPIGGSSMDNVKEIDLEQMGHRRDASQQIVQVLNTRLSGYLTTTTPLFAARKILGEFMESAYKERYG